MVVNKLLREIKNFLAGNIEAAQFAAEFNSLFFGNVEALEKESFEVYDVLYDDDFIELLPEFEAGNKKMENALRKKTAEVYFKALALLPVDQIKQAI